VQKAQCTRHFADEENDLFLFECARRLLFEQIVQSAGTRHFHEKEKPFGILKGVQQLHDERIRLTLNENVAFTFDIR
jgi:hypothetical protein